MKTQGVVLTGFILAMFPQVNYASEPDLDANPFLSDSVRKQQSAHILSFSEHSNRLPDAVKSNIINSNNSQTPDYVQLSLKTANQGFALVDSTDIANIDQLIQGFQTQKTVFEQTIKPQILNQQSLDDKLYRADQFIEDINHLKKIIDKAGFTVVTKYVGGNFIVGKGWDQLTYIISNLLFGKMILEVFCFSEGTGTVMDSDAINYYVNTHPGSLYVLQDNEGNAHTQLSWLTNKCAYSIQLAKNVNSDGLSKPFKELTQAISKG